MSTLFTGVRRSDVILTAFLSGLGVWLMVEDVVSTDASVRMDSHSWLLVPVFVVATVAVLWRRRSLAAVFAVTVVALAVHVLAFGWEVRCGAGLPLAFALAYAAGKLRDGWASVAGLVASVGVQTLVLVRDSAAGLGVLPVTALIAVAAWGVGVGLRRRSALASASVAPEQRAAVESYS